MCYFQLCYQELEARCAATQNTTTLLNVNGSWMELEWNSIQPKVIASGGDILLRKHSTQLQNIKNGNKWWKIPSQCESVAVLILTVSKFRKSEIKKKTNNSINDSMIRTIWNKAARETIDKKWCTLERGRQRREGGERGGGHWSFGIIGNKFK